jgi:hypothetical protein
MIGWLVSNAAKSGKMLFPVSLRSAPPPFFFIYDHDNEDGI